jgi:hypothetical protein
MAFSFYIDNTIEYMFHFRNAQGSFGAEVQSAAPNFAATRKARQLRLREEEAPFIGRDRSDPAGVCGGQA